MDPDPGELPGSREAMSPPSHPVLMERNLSSEESGSDSSVSTQEYLKSGSWSRTPSVASSLQSSSDLEIGSRLVSRRSPSFARVDDGGNEDDRLSTTGTAEDEKGRITTEKPEGDSFEFFPAGDTTGATREKRDSPAAVSSDRSRDRDEKDEGQGRCCECCWCCNCKSSTAGDVAGDLLSIICCPCSVVQMMLTCLCSRFPRLLKARTKDRSTSAKPPVPAIRRRAHDSHLDLSKEYSEHSQELEESEESLAHDPGRKSRRIGQDDSKAFFRTLTLSAMSPARLSRAGEEEEDKEDAKEKAEKIEKLKNKYDEQRNYFFPSPETDEDRPGGRKPGGR